MEAREIVVEKPFAEAEEKFVELVARLGGEVSRRMTHSELESLIADEGREIQRRLLQGHLDLRAANEPVQVSVQGADDVGRTHRRRRSRGLMTVFGFVTVLRMSYSARRHGCLSPLDAALNLPEELHSHGLRRLAAVEAARGSFDAAVEAMLRGTGTAVAKRQVEGLIQQAARDFDAFYDRPESAEPASEEELLCLSLDGKGIVMRRDGLREATRKAAESAQHRLDRRLSKGEKKDRKRMATVAAVYDLAVQARRPEDVLAELRPVRDAAEPRPRAKNKRVWASVEKSAEAVTSELFEEARRRDPGCRRRWVVLVDGDRHQIARVRAEAKRRGLGRDVTLVVDFIHVLEYLWDAAWCFFVEGDRGAEAWVTERAYAILQGRSSEVAGGVRRSATRRGLAEEQRAGADACADYLIAKRSMLRYDRYLRAGLPIATGVIEGACRHLIVDRLDITGARWSVRGAEAILRLRSLRSSGDFDDYWRFHLAAEHARNHASRYAAPRLRVIMGGASS
ncbi:MAG TPA: ISKra4 family transposase [Candidatus Polarisedimenticolia bacterium]|nr:ISKra4 family transposase [Candidatus Polarisedimenticolia bacterium]